jgi:6-phosphogluconate dehydrogenase
MATVGLIGLGRMGGNMARRWQQHGVNVIAFNRNHDVTKSLATECGLVAATSIEQLVQQLPAPRVVWLMLPAGAVTQQHIDAVLPLLSAGDVLVDGANSYFKDSLARAEKIHQNTSVQYVDAGVSGGVWGLQNGYCIMAGGSAAAIKTITPLVANFSASCRSRLVTHGKNGQRPFHQNGSQRH